MFNLFSLSYSNNKKPRKSVGWKDDNIHHPFVRRSEAYFCDEKMKIAGSDRKYLSSEYCRLIVLGARVAQWVRSLDLTTHTSLSPIRRGFAPVLYMFVIGTSVYYRHISKLFIDIVVFVNKELNYFICLFNFFFCVFKSWIVLFVHEELILIC